MFTSNVENLQLIKQRLPHFIFTVAYEMGSIYSIGREENWLREVGEMGPHEVPEKIQSRGRHIPTRPPSVYSQGHLPAVRPEMAPHPTPVCPGICRRLQIQEPE